MTVLGVVAMTLFVVVAAFNVGTATVAAESATTQTTLTECQDITSSGTYTLGDDITDFDSQGHPSKDICFTITADDVTFEGNGHTIELHETAILVQGDRVTVENVVVERGSGGPLVGIRYQHAADGTVRSNELTDVRTGIDLVSAQTVTVEDNTVDLSGSNGIRIRGTGTEDAVVRNNRITDSGHNGIIVETGAVENEIRNNEISGSARNGIEVRTDDNVVVGNTLTDNSHSGLSVVTGSRNEIRDNDVTQNRGPGIDFDSATNNEIVANLVEDNNGDGIYFYDSDDNLVRENDVTTNYDGVELSASSHNIVRNNTITDNTENGTYAHDRSDFNGFFYNTIDDNRDYGFAFVDAGGNEMIASSAVDNGEAAVWIAGNGVNHATDLQIGSSTYPVTIGFHNTGDVVIDTVNPESPPPDGPDPNAADDSGDGSGDGSFTPSVIDPDVRTALEESQEDIAEALNVSDKLRYERYVRVRPTRPNHPDAEPRMDSLEIYYTPSDLGCIEENTFEVWRYSPGSGSNSAGTWQPGVGENVQRHMPGYINPNPRFFNDVQLQAQGRKYVGLVNRSSTNSNLVTFAVVDEQIFAAMGEKRPGCTPSPRIADRTETNEGSPGFGIAVTVLALLVVVSRRLMDGS